METLDNTGELASQKDALQLYLDSLLNFGGGESAETSSDIVFDEIVTQVTPTEELYHAVLSEISNADNHIKTPRWATEYFSCLPVIVAEITLLVPLRQVRAVMPLSQDVDLAEDAPDWIIGEVNHSKKNVKIIDLQKIIFQKMDSPDVIEQASQLVLIGDGHWGLACDTVGKVVQLNQDEIQWRAKKTDRRWVAGISNKHQLGIVDIKRIEFAMALESRLV